MHGEYAGFRVQGSGFRAEKIASTPNVQHPTTNAQSGNFPLGRTALDVGSRLRRDMCLPRVPRGWAFVLPVPIHRVHKPVATLNPEPRTLPT